MTENYILFKLSLSSFFLLLLSHRADGGVTENSFIMQMTSDLINKAITKPVITDVSSLGAAFLAGLAVGMWYSGTKGFFCCL